MSWRRRWVVLVPGEVAWVERRTREILEEEEDGSEHHFMVIPGQRRYQAIVERGRQDVSSEMLLGRLLSLECEEPVYAVQGLDEVSYIARFLRGEEFMEDQEVEELARSLECVNEWTVEPPLEPLKKLTRAVVLIQGISMAKVRKVLEKDAGQPLSPGYYRVEETPRGVLVTDGTAELLFADSRLARQFPRATVYSVIATPGLDFFVVLMMHNRKTVQFVPPPKEATYYPAVHEIMSEREPERILAALGIPREWFQL
jgi:hypothetical protein